MINPKRHKNMLSLLERHGVATVEQLCEWLNSSPATVRRDIAWLAERKMLVRVRGGAERLPPATQLFSLSGETFQNSLGKQAAQKRAIARRAAEMCANNDTIIINGGTTTFMMTDFLAAKRLKILTNSFLMAERLLTSSNNDIILPGGQVYREQNVILSPFEDDIIKHHYAGKMFMGVYGISMLGLMEADPILIQAEKRLIGQAERLIVLADSSKFERKTGLILCRLAQVAMVITDSAVPAAARHMLEQAGVQVDVVDADLSQQAETA